MVSSHHLLFGILAYQNQLVSEQQLLQAINDWLQDKNRTIDEILLRNQVINEQESEAIELLLQRLTFGQEDAETAVLAVGADTATMLNKLRKHEDPDIYQTICQLSAPQSDSQFDPFALRPNCPADARFQVVRPHDEGGIGTVSVAVDTQLNREVAFKEIKPRFADDTISRVRFSREAEITGRLEHPGVVPIYGLGVSEDGRPYYAMRFIKGNNLSHAISTFHDDDPGSLELGKNLEFRRLLSRFLDVCNALHYAHRRGVLHRDIKPGNIMLGEFGETLVVDWGLARYYQSSLATESIDMSIQASSASLPPNYKSDDEDATLHGQVIGTPHYMSPEQARGEHDKLAPTSDVYSLGATLYSMLTNCKPFEGSAVNEVLWQVQKGPTKSARQINAQVDTALDAICRKAMSLNPKERYQSVRRMANDIERYLNDDPVEAYPDGMVRKTQRWIRKRPGIAGFISTIILAVISLAIYLYRTDYINKLETERDSLIEANKKFEHIVGHGLEVTKSFNDQLIELEQHIPMEQNLLIRGYRILAVLEGIRLQDGTLKFMHQSKHFDDLGSEIDRYLGYVAEYESSLPNQISEDLIEIHKICFELSQLYDEHLDGDEIERYLEKSSRANEAWNEGTGFTDSKPAIAESQTSSEKKGSEVSQESQRQKLKQEDLLEQRMELAKKFKKHAIEIEKVAKKSSLAARKLLERNEAHKKVFISKNDSKLEIHDTGKESVEKWYPGKYLFRTLGSLDEVESERAEADTTKDSVRPDSE